MNHPMRKLIDAVEGDTNENVAIEINEGIVDVKPAEAAIEYIDTFIDEFKKNEKVNLHAVRRNIDRLNTQLKKFKLYKKWLSHADDRKFYQDDVKSFYGINNALMALYDIVEGHQKFSFEEWAPKRDQLIEYLEIIQKHLNELITNRSPVDKLYHWLTR